MYESVDSVEELDAPVVNKVLVELETCDVTDAEVDLDETIPFSVEDYMEIINHDDDLNAELIVNVDPNKFLFNNGDGVTIYLKDHLKEYLRNVMDEGHTWILLCRKCLT